MIDAGDAAALPLMIVVAEGFIAGGADRVLANLLPYFGDYRIHVRVNAKFDTTVLFEKPLPAGTSVSRYPWITTMDLGLWAAQGRTRLARIARRALSFALRYPAMWWSYRGFKREFRRDRPSVVLINNGGYPGGAACRMAAAAAESLSGIHVVHVVHNMATPLQGQAVAIERWLDRKVVRRGVMVAVSQAVEQSLRRTRGLDAEIVTVPNGVPDEGPAEYAPTARVPLKLIHVGYLGWVKNQRCSIEALGLMAASGCRDVHITFVGKEMSLGIQGELEALARQLGVSSQVEFPGFVSDMAEVYPRFDGLLLPSIVEGMPMTILEAMRAGRATIATAVGGVGELVVDGTTGVLLTSPDPTELAKVLRRLVDDPRQLLEMGAKARQRFIAHYTLDAQAQAYGALVRR